MPLFCRHNRYTADCPICSKGTALDPSARPARRPRQASGGGRGASRRGGGTAPAPAYRGPYASVGLYLGDDAEEYEVRLERVPGGLRLAEWAAGLLRKRAPVLDAADLPQLLAAALEHGGLREADVAALRGALAGAGLPEGPEGVVGASGGRAGELRDELRVEVLPGGRLRIARWIERPNYGWELQDAPVMLPAARYAQALAAASGAQGEMRP